MIRYLYRDQNGELHLDQQIELACALDDSDGFVWLDLREEPVESAERLLREGFNFHPLAVDDALVERHVPKLDDWGEYVYIVLHAFDLDWGKDEPVKTQEVDFFVGHNYVVTYQSQAIETVDHIWDLASRDERLLGKGSAFLLYHLADELVAEVVPLADQIGNRLDLIEDEILLAQRSDIVPRILQLKRAIFALQRVIMPQREVLNRLSRGDCKVIALDQRMYFRDVYDHLVRLQDIVEGLCDLIGSVLEIHLSVVNNRMNEVMKVLTVITTLFMPITFITGFFGMNFFEPTLSSALWTGEFVFQGVLLLLIVTPVLMLLWMRNRHWM